MMITTISKGQQITIPAEMRHALGLDIGSRIEIEQKGKKIIIQPVGEDLEEMFKQTDNIKPKYPNMTAKEMDDLNERMFSEIHR